MSKICIIDDEKSICESLKWILEKEGHEVKFETTFESGKQLILNEDFDLYFVDLVLPGGTGIDLIKVKEESKKDGKVIVITGYPSTPTLVDSVRLQVYDYLSKPVNPSDVTKIAELAIKDVDKVKRRESNE